MTNATSCIDACIECAKACEACAARCVADGDADCLRKCLDGAAVCWQTAAFQSHQSAWAADMAALCQKVCIECVDDCAKRTGSEYQQCADACRRCGQTCATI